MIRVLVVDDSLTVRMDLGQLFDESGFVATLAGSLAEAREALGSARFDAVVLDVVLPDADGVEFLRELKNDDTTKTIPVVLLSSEAEVAARIRGLRTGADEYVGKPYDATYLVARLRELVGRSGVVDGAARRRILLVDDSPTFRHAMRALLEGAGYDVLVAETGEAGLLAAVERRPSAIIVDGILPGIDGPTVIQRVRADSRLRRTPCVLLTASSEAAGELEALDAGADAYLRKDDDPAIVLARLRAVLRSSAEAPVPDARTSMLGPKKILAVDDSATYLEELGQQLLQQGYDVVLARSGEEALALLAAQPVDCILMDVVMPGMSGPEACRIIKGSPTLRDIPLVLHTAREEHLAMVEGIDAGADDYITKSSSFEVLRARLRAQLRRRQFEDENRSIREQLLQKEIEAAETRAARALAETRATLLAELQAKNGELERAQRALELRNERINEQNRLKSEFLANMSHELRTPLNAILGFGEMLQDGVVPPDSPRFRDFIGHILTSGRHLLQLINDVLDLSKVEAGKLDLRPERASLDRLLGEVVAILRSTVTSKSLQIEVEIDPGVSSVVLDPARFKQVAYNYLSNAFKFTPAGGRVVLRVTPEGEQAFRFEVEDSGIGIAERDLARLFVEFAQLESGRERDGTGLGLAFTKRLVEAQGGRVGVRSVLGQGSTFFAVLPRDTSHVESA